MTIDGIRFAGDELLQRGRVGLVCEPARLVRIQQFVELIDKAVESLLGVDEHAVRIAWRLESQFHISPSAVPSQLRRPQDCAAADLAETCRSRPDSVRASVRSRSQSSGGRPLSNIRRKTR